MGCTSSKLDDLPAVALCRMRCSFLDAAIRHRYALAEAHVAYMLSLKGVGHSFEGFFTHSIVANSSSGPNLKLPAQKKGGDGGHAVSVDRRPAGANSPSKGSNSGSHLQFHSDSDDEDDDSFAHSLHHSGHSSPLHAPEGHIEYMSSDQEMVMRGMSSYPGGFLHMNYMRNRATPSVVYEQKPVTSETVHMGESSTSSSYHLYPYQSNPFHLNGSAPYHGHNSNAGGYGSGMDGPYSMAGNYGSSSPLRRPVEEKPPPPPPPPPTASAWDFLNPFETFDRYYPPYTPSRDSKELREAEGIPDLEDEHEVVKEVHGHPKFVDVRNFSKSVVVEDEEEEEDEKADGGASTSLYHTRPSVSLDNVNDGGEYEVVVDKVVDGEGKSDEGGNAARFKGPRGLSEVVREVVIQFEKASASGHEIAKMLEAGKVPHKRRSQGSSKTTHAGAVSSVVSSQPPAKVADPSSSGENVGPASLGLDEEMVTRTKNLSSTLQKLYLWEKKLYNEVKAEEKMRVIHDRKLQKLKRLDERGAEIHKVESTRTVIRSLSTKIGMAIQVVDKISSTINKIRDEELWPQINELIRGLMRMWKSLLECHRIQYQVMTEAQSFGPIASAKKLENSSVDITMQFQRELISWADRFTNWVLAQKEYVTALNNWLLKCLVYEPEETADGIVPFSPGRIGAPPIFVICNQWFQALDRISEKEVINAMFAFTSGVFQLRERDRREMQESMMLNKDLDREDQRIQKEIQALEKKIIQLSGSSDIQVVYQGEVSNNMQVNLQHVFEAMERFTAESMKLYEELVQRSEEEEKIALERMGIS